MKIGHLIAALLIAAAPNSGAIVIRDDVPDARYRVAGSDIPALADLPEEGHGVLISKQWVVTAGHAVRWGTPKFVEINGKRRAVSMMVVNPGFKMPSKNLLSMSGDAAPLMAALEANDDIALLKLAEPIEDVRPLLRYDGSNELGKLVKIYGKGATGNGAVGQYPNSPHRGELRRACNRIIKADGKWLAYRFDAPPNAEPLEGMLGDGDSGGPVLMEENGVWKLVGLADWKFWQGELSKFRPGIYGEISYHVRVSYYREWIDGVIATH